MQWLLHVARPCLVSSPWALESRSFECVVAAAGDAVAHQHCRCLMQAVSHYCARASCSRIGQSCMSCPCPASAIKRKKAFLQLLVPVLTPRLGAREANEDWPVRSIGLDQRGIQCHGGAVCVQRLLRSELRYLCTFEIFTLRNSEP
eukprot:6178688-Pleurochrysis_carterae.AAC.3